MEEIIDNFGVIIGRNMLKIYAGIVTYNPDIELLKKNINAIYNQVEEVVIIDNGSENLLKWKKELELKYVRITIISNNQNCGIAKALNQICCFGLKKSYNWVLTLDQDSISPDNLVRCMKENLDNNIAVIAPNIIYKNNEEYIDKSIKGCRDVEWVITSASLTNLLVWEKIKGFDELLFIDGVDRDFCIRANRSGYRIIKDYDICLLHELGNLKCRRYFGRTIYVTNHSKFRKYYMARNVIYLDKKLGLNFKFKYIFKLLLKTMLYENDKIKKIKAISKGIRDGFCLASNIKD